jgi:serine/threonine-protein kinase
VQEAIRLKKDFAEAHCNLGLVYLRQGHFTQAVEELRLGHTLGSRNPLWPFPSAQWLRKAERLVEVDQMLTQFLKGEVAPASAAERAELGWLCRQRYKQLNAAAARLYTEAFAAEPKLAANSHAQHRYHAICAAILAGCGQGKDADTLDDQEKTRLRRQALTWLQADLAAWRKQLQDGEAKTRPIVQQTMQQCLANTELAVVRDPQALARLPEGERQEWQKLWADINELVARNEMKRSRERN